MNRQELLREKIEEVLESKCDEFHMLGYDGVTVDDIWACINEKYKDEWPPLHLIVNDIYSLRPTKLMNWLTIGAYTGKIDFAQNPPL